jgi:hypothetical protein
MVCVCLMSNSSSSIERIEMVHGADPPLGESGATLRK